MAQQRVQPPDQTTQRSDTPACEAEAFVTGVQWIYPVDQGKKTWFTDERILLGRGDDCDVRLRSYEISRHHAEIRHEGPIFIVRDVGSTNGVFVNGVRVGEAVLSIGDIVRLGDCIGLIFQGMPDNSAAPIGVTCEHGLVSGDVLGPVISVAKQSATLGLSIVIQGETGTGKELFARAIHAWSGRKGPFVAINCAALAPALAEAELFGYRKGAFTGADRPSPGYFRAADGGTLLLDEIADLPLAIQPKLLRVLEQREVVPVGESRPVAVDVRLLAATQISLSDRVAQELFRADLLARLEGVVLRLPSLRERLEELPALFDWFLRKHSGGASLVVDARLVEALCLYDWPRNIRELEQLVRQLAGLHGQASRLKCVHLPPHLQPRERCSSPLDAVDAAGSGFGAREAREFASLARALRLQGGNVSRAAADVGISRQRAYRLLVAHPEFDPDAYRRSCRSAKSDKPQGDAP